MTAIWNNPTQTIPENDITDTKDGPTICRANGGSRALSCWNPPERKMDRDSDEQDLKCGEEQSHCKQQPSDALQRMQEENDDTAQASASR